MKKPKISVIIPVHNGEETLAGCLDRILGQKGPVAFEVIVVDDASTDSTSEIARRSPVKLVELKENLGAGSARNRGADIAEGELLFFLDSDVYLEPSALRLTNAFFERQADFCALVGSYTNFPACGNLFSFYHNFFTFYHHNLSSKEVEWFWGALGVVRKDAFERVGGFREDYPGANAEDLEFGYRLSEAGYKIAYSREIRGEHARHFDLRSMLYNDYRKSLLGTKLYITRKKRGVGKHGFSNFRNGLSLGFICLFWLGFVIWLFGGGPEFATSSFLFFAGLNLPFYHFIYKQAGFEKLFNALWLHFPQFNAIAGGALMGLIGLSLGRGLQSRSRWL